MIRLLTAGKMCRLLSASQPCIARLRCNLVLCVFCATKYWEVVKIHFKRRPRDIT